MNPEKVGSLIKKIRLEHGLTQAEFANLFGVTYQAVSKWENGRNIPDIAVLTEICNTYHYDIQEFLNGEKVEVNKSKKNIYLVGGIVCIFVFLFLCIFLFSKDTFQFKTLSSNCSSFEITGSMAYNKEKTSIYISNVSYCGEEDQTKYQTLSCSLYESNETNNIKIEDCPKKEEKEITLEEYLKDVKFQVDDYMKTCKNYTSNSLYLEITGIEKNGGESTFKIPLKLEDNCSFK